MRKIEDRELAVIMLNHIVVCLRSLFSRVEVAYADGTALDIESSNPFLLSAIPTYTPIPRRVVAPLPSVIQILVMRATMEIVSAVVQAIMVAVIDFLARLWRHDEIMHQYHSLFVPSSCVGDMFLGLSHTPVVLRQPLEVCSVNDSVSTLGEWNETIGWIRWLHNCVALYLESLAPLWRHRGLYYNTAGGIQ